MSKFDDAIESYKKVMTGTLSMNVDSDLLTGVAKALGPSIYLKDASLVSCSDDTELNRVKANFCVKKLGLSEGAAVDAAVKEVCEKMSAVKQKPRAVFYYHLVQKFGKEGMFKK